LLIFDLLKVQLLRLQFEFEIDDYQYCHDYDYYNPPITENECKLFNSV